MGDYAFPERRRTKKDLKRKRLARAYKHGGRFRTSEVDSHSGLSGEENKGKSRESLPDNEKSIEWRRKTPEASLSIAQRKEFSKVGKRHIDI